MPKVRYKLRKNGIFLDISFSKITFWKKKTLTSLVNYSTEITFQNKEKYSTHYNYSILQLEYFISSKFTVTRVFMHTSWLPEKSAAARSARSHDKVQTCYFHQGNNDTRILGEKFQEYGGR